MSTASKAFVEFVKLYLDQEYEVTQKYGYSSQTFLARTINEVLYNNKYYCWFAKDFNAYRNGDDSNPLFIYMTVDRAVKQGGINNAKIKDIRSNLMRAVQIVLTGQQRYQDIEETWFVISQAPLSWMRPEIWRLDLNAIEGRYTKGTQYPDEFLIKDLTKSEFTIIVE